MIRSVPMGSINYQIFEQIFKLILTQIVNVGILFLRTCRKMTKVKVNGINH